MLASRLEVEQYLKWHQMDKFLGNPRGSDRIKSVLAKIHGADRKFGTIREIFLATPRLTR